MESGYVPVQVNSGVRRGSEEGTEVIVKHKWVEEKRGKKFLFIGLFVILLGVLFLFWGQFLLQILLRPFGLYIEEFIALFGGAMLGFSLMVFGAWLATEERERFENIIKEEKETQIKIFIPKVLLSNISQIDTITEWGHIDIYEETFPPSLDEPFPQLSHEKEGYFWVEGKGNNGCDYYVRFLDEKLYDTIIQKRKQKRLQEALEKIKYLETVGRYEEAARIYEILNMPEKAGEMRRKKREIVALDLNGLIRQLGERGFTITYHCSHCGAPVSISGETNAEAIQFCSHCGSRIETIDVANFIKKYLS